MRGSATYRQTILAYTFAAPLLMLGLPRALYYFLPGQEHRARALLHENLLLLTLMGGVFSLFLLLGGNRLLAWRFNNPDLAETLLTLAPYPLLMLPGAAIDACLLARDRAWQAAVFNVLGQVVLLVIVVSAAVIWRTPVATIMMVWLWSMPFSMAMIARQYGPPLGGAFPYVELAKILGVSAVACVVFLPNAYMGQVHSLVRLSIFAPAYIGCVCFLLVRTRLLDWRSLVNASRQGRQQ